ncbi:hypothetical protein [Stieleria varia]|uniref:Uncharacterized protein n=1 Tax=Stieleria varia TaxID=2528005 RepID=A0A5C6A1U6_9BACT|nr:hypothetical protein [Stieleria varia]TWT93257.1 hypothetical protein Pla52n_59150 [Stieleria varia]
MKLFDIETEGKKPARPWFQLFLLHVDRRTAREWFGTEPFVEFVQGLGDADIWAVKFDCGLTVGFEFLHLETGGSIRASEPNPSHVQRHFQNWKSKLEPYPASTFADLDAMTIDHYAERHPELLEPRSYQLWRQGDDGNEMPIGEPTSLLDAKCWQTELESHKHKQIYWVSKLDSTGKKG